MEPAHQTELAAALQAVQAKICRASPALSGSDRPQRRQRLRWNEAPVRIHLPHLRRDRGLIHPDLRAILNDLFLGKADWPLLLEGSVGTGKTRAALFALDMGGGCYWTVKELHDALCAAQAGRYSTIGFNGCSYPCGVESIWDGIGRARLAVLDELGQREKVSEAQYETVKTFLDVRECKPAIFISNLDLDALDPIYDYRVTDRLACGTRMNLEGQSRRGNAQEEPF